MLKNYYKNMFDFRGTSSRREYWLTTLYSALVFMGVVLIPLTLVAIPTMATSKGNESSGNAVAGLIVLVFVLIYAVNAIASISLLVRRIRDTGKSPWLVLLCLVPVANIYVFILTLME